MKYLKTLKKKRSNKINSSHNLNIEKGHDNNNNQLDRSKTKKKTNKRGSAENLDSIINNNLNNNQNNNQTINPNNNQIINPNNNRNSNSSYSEISSYVKTNNVKLKKRRLLCIPLCF